MVFSHGNLVAHWKNKVEDTQLFRWLHLHAGSFQVIWAAAATRDSCPSSIKEAFGGGGGVLLCHLC